MNSICNVGQKKIAYAIQWTKCTILNIEILNWIFKIRIARITCMIDIEIFFKIRTCSYKLETFIPTIHTRYTNVLQ